jgi:hypothetical protein
MLGESRRWLMLRMRVVWDSPSAVGAAPWYRCGTCGDGVRVRSVSVGASLCSSGTVSTQSYLRKTAIYTRQTTAAQRWHSPTMSLAQRPTLPDVSWNGDLTALLATPSPSSLTQCSVCRTNWSRYSSKLARNCRHDRDRSCSELRSSWPASWRTILYALTH